MDHHLIIIPPTFLFHSDGGPIGLIKDRDHSTFWYHNNEIPSKNWVQMGLNTPFTVKRIIFIGA